MRVPIVLLLLAATAGADRPRLVVFIAVDQMRPDTLTRFRNDYTGGLKRLLEGGLRFRGILDHAATQTGPGHSTMLTGCRPASTGIVANRWLDRETQASVYCVEAADAPVFGVPKTKHRSPRLLLRTTLGDWMKSADKRARVYSVSCKDRAAILMGGKHPDGVYWLEREGDGFSTSAYYHPNGRPGWLRAFNHDGWLDELPEQWTYEPVAGLRDDDDPRESAQNSRKSPHPLRGKDRAQTLRRVYASPYGDAFVLRLARLLVERFELGSDEVTDLLALSLSSTDTVGHPYGPFSQEIRATELALDRNLGAFFDFLDRRGAPYVVVLTADHGVLPIPAMKRGPAGPLLQRLQAGVRKRLGAGDWYRLSSSEIYLRGKPEQAARTKQALTEVLKREQALAAVFDRSQLAGPGRGLLLDLFRKSFHPQRSGDLFVVPKKNVLLSVWPTGTSHGSPYRYDREVPLLFFGRGIPCGERDREARTIDIAPTLARRIGVAVPPGVDGAALPLE